MRDGTELAADVKLPAGDGPFPTIVTRTPYMRGRLTAQTSWGRLVDYGFAYVAVDVRGRGDSEGDFAPFIEDSSDGFDTVEWAAEQIWSDGKVGMVGVSYDALTQWWTVKAKPPHLRCIAPMAMGAAKIGPRPGADTGVPALFWMWWFNMVSGRTMQNPMAASWESNLLRLPLRTLHEEIGVAKKFWPLYVQGRIDWLSDDFVLSDDDWINVDIPVLVALGWWDDQNTVQNWLALRRSRAAASARLLIGPWDHPGNIAPRPEFGGLDVSESIEDNLSYVAGFMAEHLKAQRPPESKKVPVCRIFRTGRMRWEETLDWPAPTTKPHSWYLASDGSAEGLSGNGLLAQTPPTRCGADAFTYDPEDPPRAFSNLNSTTWGDPPLDSRYWMRRADVLVYTSSELVQPINVSGLAEFDGYVAIDAPDTDIGVTLYDVCPDGRAILVSGDVPQAVLRLSHREGYHQKPMSPGDVVRVRIPITWLHHTFLAGHRIAMSISPAGMPTFARNLNGGESWADAIRASVVRISIHRGPKHRSQLVLPVEGDALV
ncbi:CocE/NonD family hydrolase [Jatrophihabitans sp. DSM 45814]